MSEKNHLTQGWQAWNCSACDGIIDEQYALTPEGVYIYVKRLDDVMQVYATLRATASGFVNNYVGDTLFGRWEVWARHFPDKPPAPTNVIWHGYETTNSRNTMEVLNQFKAGLGIRVN